MKANNFYLEVTENEKVVKRVKTSMLNHQDDWRKLQQTIKESQQITLSVSSEKEKVFTLTN